MTLAEDAAIVEDEIGDDHDQEQRRVVYQPQLKNHVLRNVFNQVDSLDFTTGSLLHLYQASSTVRDIDWRPTWSANP